MELLETISGVDAVVVSGESGVGKSALAVLGLTAAGDAGPDSLRALCINLRQIPRLAIELEATLGCPLSTLLCELSAPQRMLVVDGGTPPPKTGSTRFAAWLVPLGRAPSK